MTNYDAHVNATKCFPTNIPRQDQVHFGTNRNYLDSQIKPKRSTLNLVLVFYVIFANFTDIGK